MLQLLDSRFASWGETRILEPAYHKHEQPPGSRFC